MDHFTANSVAGHMLIMLINNQVRLVRLQKVTHSIYWALHQDEYILGEPSRSSLQHFWVNTIHVILSNVKRQLDTVLHKYKSL